jgi:hypothetical protein
MADKTYTIEITEGDRAQIECVVKQLEKGKRPDLGQAVRLIELFKRIKAQLGIV